MARTSASPLRSISCAADNSPRSQSSSAKSQNVNPADAMNPRSYSGISIGYAVGSVAEWLRQITVRIIGSRGSRRSGVLSLAQGLVVTQAPVADFAVHTGEVYRGRRLQR